MKTFFIHECNTESSLFLVYIPSTRLTNWLTISTLCLHRFDHYLPTNFILTERLWMRWFQATSLRIKDSCGAVYIESLGTYSAGASEKATLNRTLISPIVIRQNCLPSLTPAMQLLKFTPPTTEQAVQVFFKCGALKYSSTEPRASFLAKSRQTMS